jgi:hypothetical protein
LRPAARESDPFTPPRGQRTGNARGQLVCRHMGRAEQKSGERRLCGGVLSHAPHRGSGRAELSPRAKRPRGRSARRVLPVRKAPATIAGEREGAQPQQRFPDGRCSLPPANRIRNPDGPSGRPRRGLLALCGLPPVQPSCQTASYLLRWHCTEHGARLGRSRLCGSYAEAARPGEKLVETVDESATGSVYSFLR